MIDNVKRQYATADPLTVRLETHHCHSESQIDLNVECARRRQTLDRITACHMLNLVPDDPTLLMESWLRAEAAAPGGVWHEPKNVGIYTGKPGSAQQ